PTSCTSTPVCTTTPCCSSSACTRSTVLSTMVHAPLLRGTAASGNYRAWYATERPCTIHPCNGRRFDRFPVALIDWSKEICKSFHSVKRFTELAPEDQKQWAAFFLLLFRPSARRSHLNRCFFVFPEYMPDRCSVLFQKG